MSDDPAPSVQYRPIGSSERYRVGSDGFVQSWWKGAWHPLRPHRRGRGYLVVQYSVGGQSYRRCVHHLVLEAFVGPRPPGACARHLDGNRDNNAASNLAWGSLSENVRDSIRQGTHGATKLTPEEVVEIRGSNEPYSAIAARYGIARGHVWSIRSRRSWAWV